MFATGTEFGLGNCSIREDDEIRSECQDVVFVDIAVTLNVHATSLQLRHPPVDDTDKIASPVSGSSKPQLPTRLVGRIDNRYIVAALSKHPGCF